MSFSLLARLAAKELRETLRDRRTILTLVLMPVLLYPLLSLGFQRFLIVQTRLEAPHFRLGVGSRDEVPHVQRLMDLGAAVLEREVEGQSPATAELYVTENLNDAVQHGDIDVGLRVLRHVPGSPRQGEQTDLEVLSVGTLSGPAVEFVRTRLRAAGQAILVNRLHEMRMSWSPVNISVKSLTAARGSRAFNLAVLVPLVLVLMTITGAVYPAIDLTAGERERNTMELLVAAPVPKLGLLLAKYAAVVTVAFLTAGLNLVSMAVTLQSSGLGPLVWGERGLSLVTALQVFALLGLFAAFFSAVLLCITSFARSFKEAQAYLVPLMLVSISPGLLTLLPELKLTGPLSVIPLLNVTLLARDLLAGRAEMLTALTVVGTTVLYGAAALGLASRIFGADAVLYDARTGWGELFERPSRSQDAPSLALALGSLAILFSAAFLATGLLAQQVEVTPSTGATAPPPGWSIHERLIANSLMAAALFAVVPTAIAIWRRVRLRPAFHVRAASLLGFAGAILLGLSLWPLVHELVVLVLRTGIVTFSQEYLDRGRNVVRRLAEVPFPLVLVSLALVPALSEEWLFRGFIFSALRRRLKPWTAVIACGVLFGAFHLVATDTLAIERFPPSAVLGCVLAWVCWKTDSVFPGMVLHAVHNAANLVLSRFGEAWAAKGWIPKELLADQAVPPHLPTSWLGLAILGTAAGLGLVWAGKATEAISETERRFET